MFVSRLARNFRRGLCSALAATENQAAETGAENTRPGLSTEEPAFDAASNRSSYG